MGGKLCRLVGRYFFMSQYLLQGCHTPIKAKFPVFSIFFLGSVYRGRGGGMYPSMQWARGMYPSMQWAGVYLSMQWGVSDSGLWGMYPSMQWGRGVCLWVQGSVHHPRQTPHTSRQTRPPPQDGHWSIGMHSCWFVPPAQYLPLNQKTVAVSHHNKVESQGFTLGAKPFFATFKKKKKKNLPAVCGTQIGIKAKDCQTYILRLCAALALCRTRTTVMNWNQNCLKV